MVITLLSEMLKMKDLLFAVDDISEENGKIRLSHKNWNGRSKEYDYYWFTLLLSP